MKINIFFIFILALYFFCCHSVFGQKRKNIKWIKIEHADRLENGYSATGVEFQRLISRVRFYHNGTRMWCDSAHYFAKKNQFIAFGKIRIRQGDSINITAKKLNYDGRNRIAELREDVIYKDDSVTLTTNYFDYDMQNKLAYYLNGGKIVDRENTLTSNKGYYQTDAKRISFKGDAVLVGKEATIKSDTLQYDARNKITFFLGKTHISQKNGDHLITDYGQYGDQLKNSIFHNATIKSDNNYQITGDILETEKNNTAYNAKKNVILVQKQDSIIITGDYGYYNKQDSIAFVRGNAVFRKIFAKDTLYIKADTLKFIDNPLKIHKKIMAYHKVQIMKNDLKAKADSLIANNYDSTIHLFNAPIVWKGKAQATAEKMEVKIDNENIKRIDLLNTAFLISQDSISLEFNQLTGRNLTVFFKDNQLNYADIYGNAENLFHITEEEKQKSSSINNMESKNMRITFKNGELDAVKSYVNVNGKIIPEEDLKEDEEKLNDFDWKEEKAPKLENFYPQGIPNLPLNLFAEVAIKEDIDNENLAKQPPDKLPSSLEKTKKKDSRPKEKEKSNSTRTKDNKNQKKKKNIEVKKKKNTAIKKKKNIEVKKKKNTAIKKKSLATKRKERAVRKKRKRIKKIKEKQKKIFKRKKRKKERQLKRDVRQKGKKAKKDLKEAKKNMKYFIIKRKKLKKRKERKLKKKKKNDAIALLGRDN